MRQDEADVLSVDLIGAHHPISACRKRGHRAWLDIEGGLSFEQARLPAIGLNIGGWNNVHIPAEESRIQGELERCRAEKNYSPGPIHGQRVDQTINHPTRGCLPVKRRPPRLLEGWHDTPQPTALSRRRC